MEGKNLILAISLSALVLIMWSIFFAPPPPTIIRNKIRQKKLKKKIGSSVIRNKIKRRLRSGIQKRLKNKKFRDINYSYIIFGKLKAFTEKYSIISDELDKTFYKINQINK